MTSSSSSETNTTFASKDSPSQEIILTTLSTLALSVSRSLAFMVSTLEPDVKVAARRFVDEVHVRLGFVHARGSVDLGPVGADLSNDFTCLVDWPGSRSDEFLCRRRVAHWNPSSHLRRTVPRSPRQAVAKQSARSNETSLERKCRGEL